MLVSSVLTITYIQETKKIVQDTKNIMQQNAKIGTAQRLATLDTLGDVLKLQLSNEEQLKQNLTSHRVIANLTYDKIFQVQNDTQKLIKALNNTNEDGRAKAVETLHSDHQMMLDLVKQNNDILNRLRNHTVNDTNG